MGRGGPSPRYSSFTSADKARISFTPADKARVELRDSETSRGGQPRSGGAAGGSREAGEAELWACRFSDEGMPEWYRRAQETAKARNQEYKLLCVYLVWLPFEIRSFC